MLVGRVLLQQLQMSLARLRRVPRQVLHFVFIVGGAARFRTRRRRA